MEQSACNYTMLDSLFTKKGKVDGAIVQDQLTGENIMVRAKKVVNATGPWVDEIRENEIIRKRENFATYKRGSYCYRPILLFPLEASYLF